MSFIIQSCILTVQRMGKKPREIGLEHQHKEKTGKTDGLYWSHSSFIMALSSKIFLLMAAKQGRFQIFFWGGGAGQRGPLHPCVHFLSVHPSCALLASPASVHAHSHLQCPQHFLWWQWAACAAGSLGSRVFRQGKGMVGVSSSGPWQKPWAWQLSHLRVCWCQLCCQAPGWGSGRKKMWCWLRDHDTYDKKGSDIR